MDTSSSQHRIALRSLRLHWTALAGVSLAFLSIAGLLLAKSRDQSSAMSWFALGLGITMLLLWILWRNLPANHRQGESQLLSTLGAANTITFLRGLFVATAAGFLLLPPLSGSSAFLPAAFYALATLGDFLDGYFARRHDHATHLGEILDMYVDSIGVLVAVLLLVHYEKVPAWYLLVGLARYIFLAGIWLRQRFHLPIHALPPSDIRRALAAVQMNFILILLWPLFSPPATIFGSVAFAIPFLAFFLRDWFIVSGVIAPQITFPTWIRKVTLDGLPVILRLIAFSIAIFPVLARMLTSPPQADLFGYLGSLLPQRPLTIWLLLYLAVPLMLLVGFAGRSASLAGLILLGITQNYSPLTSSQMLLVITLAAIFHLGTGLLSAWKPEDRLISLRVGQSPAKARSQESSVANQLPLGSLPSSLHEIP